MFLALIEGREKTNGSVSGTSSVLSESEPALFESGMCSCRLRYLPGCIPDSVRFIEQPLNLIRLAMLET